MSTRDREQGGYLPHGHLREEFHQRRKTKAVRKDAAQCRVDRTVCAHNLRKPFVRDAHINVF